MYAREQYEKELQMAVLASFALKLNVTPDQATEICGDLAMSIISGLVDVVSSLFSDEPTPGCDCPSCKVKQNAKQETKENVTKPDTKTEPQEP
jgi:hypothetical protein